MQADKAIDAISHTERREEPKSDSQAETNTFECIEEEPEPHLHLKTWLIVAVSLYERICRTGPLTNIQAVSFVSFAQLIQLVAAGAVGSLINRCGRTADPITAFHHRGHSGWGRRAIQLDAFLAHHHVCRVCASCQPSGRLLGSTLVVDYPCITRMCRNHHHLSSNLRRCFSKLIWHN